MILSKCASSGVKATPWKLNLAMMLHALVERKSLAHLKETDRLLVQLAHFALDGTAAVRASAKTTFSLLSDASYACGFTTNVIEGILKGSLPEHSFAKIKKFLEQQPQSNVA